MSDEDTTKRRTLTGVEIFRAGMWNGDKYTVKDLDDMVAAFGSIGFKPPVKYGHEEKSGAPAVGWVENLRRTGDMLVADLADLSEVAYQAIKDRRYDGKSAEIFWNLKRGGQFFRRVLKAVALLGAEIPAVDLKPLREEFHALQFDSVHQYSTDQRKDPNMAKQTGELTDDELKDLDTDTPSEKKLKAALRTMKAESQGAGAASEIKKLTEQLEQTQADMLAIKQTQHRKEVEAKVARLKIPVLRPVLQALYELEADAPRTVQFSVDGKAENLKDTTGERVLDSLVDALNKQAAKLFRELGSDGLQREEDADPEDAGSDVGEEVVNKVADYIKEHKLDSTKDYRMALREVLHADPELSERYNQTIS